MKFILQLVFLGLIILVPVCIYHVVILKQEGNAPQGGNTYQCVYDSCQHCALSAKQPGNQVELENTYKAPVNPAYNQEHQCNDIYDDQSNYHLFLRLVIVWTRFHKIYTINFLSFEVVREACPHG